MKHYNLMTFTLTRLIFLECLGLDETIWHTIFVKQFKNKITASKDNMKKSSVSLSFKLVTILINPCSSPSYQSVISSSDINSDITSWSKAFKYVLLHWYTEVFSCWFVVGRTNTWNQNFCRNLIFRRVKSYCHSFTNRLVFPVLQATTIRSHNYY